MSDFFVAPIVEGHGEVQAVPILLQRMLFELRDDAFLRVNPALRVKAGSFLNDHVRRVGGLPADLNPPAAPELIRGAKGWLAAQLPHGYNEPNDQPGFTSAFSFDEAATIPSFARLRRKLHEHFAA